MSDLNIPAKATGDTLSAAELNQIVTAVNTKQDSVSGKGLSTNDYTDSDKQKLSVFDQKLSDYDQKISDLESKIEMISGAVVSLTETETGVFKYAGKSYPLYELTAELSGLPISAGGSVDIILSDQPYGDQLYLAVECISVATSEGFSPSAYTVDKIFIDDNGNTVVRITCKVSIEEAAKVLLTIRYVRGMLSYDSFELSIPVSELGISSADEVGVEMPALKYGKKFALSWTTDDSILGVYSLIHKYINKKYIDDEYNFHDWMTPTTGFTPDRVLCSTDNCGNDIRFRVDSGWFSYSSRGSDEIHSNTYPYHYVSWVEMIVFLDFFNTALNHGGGDQTKPLESIQMCGDRLYEVTGYFPYLLLVPGDTSGYPETAETLDYIYHYHDKNNLNYSTDALTKASFQVKTGLLGRKTYDGMTYQELCAYVDAEASRTDHPYIYMGGHVVSDTSAQQISWSDAVKPFFDYLHDTYGKGGNDSIWFAGPEEVYEYLFTRAYSFVSKSVVDGNLVIKTKVARLPYFKRNEFSLMLNKASGTPSVSTLNITGSKDVMRTAFAAHAEGLLINVNYNEAILELAEKYTAQYESSSALTVKEDALYFANMLSEELKAPFIERISAGDVPPVLNSVVINAGASVTYDPDVIVGLTVSGVISHYRMSESASDLVIGSWVPGTSLQVIFVLSHEYGTKTVYVQVKNEHGESSILSDSISYEEAPANAFTVTGQSNDASYGSVTPASQIVTQGGTAQLSAVANEGYVIVDWSGASSGTGTGLASGTATVSNVQSNVAVVCNFIQSASGSGGKIILFPADNPSTVTLPNGDQASIVRARFSTSQSDSEVVNTSGESSGSKVVSSANLPSGVADTEMSASTSPILSGNTGVYPDQYIGSMFGVYGSGVYPSLCGIVRLKEMKEGTYTVRILYSTQKTLTSAQITGITYEANGVLVNAASGFNPTNNNTEFIEINNVIVGSDGILDIYMGNTQTYVRTGWNAIEIEEV